MEDFKQSVSGYSVEGSWSDIVEMGERLVFALDNSQDIEKFSEELKEFNRWRPKVHESLDPDIKSKTSKKASLDIKSSENTQSEYFRNMIQSGKSCLFRDCLKQFYNILRSFPRKAFRKTEMFVYEDVMTQISPYYFDNRLVSANIDKIDVGQYHLEVNVNNDEIKSQVTENLSEYQDKYERWHIGKNLDDRSITESEGIDNIGSTKSPEEYNPDA